MDYHANSPQQTLVTKSPFFIASLVLGIISILTICTVILPLICGGLSILFAILSHRKGEDLNGLALTGVICSSISMAFTIVTFALVLIQLPHNLKDEQYLEQLNTTSEALYGVTFEEMLEESGIDLDSLLD